MPNDEHTVKCVGGGRLPLMKIHGKKPMAAPVRSGGNRRGRVLSVPGRNLLFVLIFGIAFALSVWRPAESGAAVGGRVVNVATANLNGSSQPSSVSNTVVAVIQVAPTITYFTGGDFTTVATVSFLDYPLYVEANAAACNRDSKAVETTVITMASSLTGDIETYLATETGPDTGRFRILPNVPTRNGDKNPVVPGNKILEIVKNDIVTARIEGCGSGSSETVILIDPYGVVFDSRTNSPVSGVVVTLLDVTGEGNGGNPGGPAKVYTSYDFSEEAPSTVTTGADGVFSFPLVLPSTYRLSLGVPSGYSFPSQVAAGDLPAGRVINLPGSYGGDFLVSNATGTVRLDVPLDSTGGGGLFIRKLPSRYEVELGDFLDYVLEIKNATGHPVTALTVTDTLPLGFAYQRNTTRINGRAAPNPAGGGGPRLTFSVGDVADGSIVILRYRVLVGPASQLGDGTNRAQARGDDGSTSNTASVTVQILPGVFSEKGFIVGRIFADCNRNGIQDDGETGIPGVRLFLEDGTFVITDGEGKYSFYGIVPRSHVLKVDRTTLPEGSELIPASNRHALDPGSRFIDLKKGELQKADFAEGSCSEGVLREVNSRIAEAEAFVPESEKGVHAGLSADRTRESPTDLRSQPATGLKEQGASVPAFASVIPERAIPGQNDILPDEPFLKAPLFPFEKRLPEMDGATAFVDLADGDVLPYSQMNVVVKGPAGVRLTLSVNGEEIPEGLVGKKASIPEKGVEAWEYIGIDLKAGTNELVLTGIDGAGGTVGSAKLMVTAPGNLGRIIISLPPGETPADGRSTALLRVEITDDNGVPVTVRTPVTLETSLGEWQVEDLDDVEPGVQVFVEGGRSDFALRSPLEAGDAMIRVSSGTLMSEKKLFFAPDLRPMIAAGIIEGVIGFRKIDRDAIIEARSQDGFEQEIRELSFTGDDGRIQGGGRAALYLKGKIKGDYLLTLAYDSDKNTDEPLFRDIEPDQFYPVYGDSSVRGFDAQSTEKLYVRIDKNRSYLLYGDFITQEPQDVRRLGSYPRSLTGVKGHYENSWVSINAFASEGTSRQVVEELPGRGVSGPYPIGNRDIIPNSEKVEIITRDRNHPSIVIKTEPQTRFSDYEIDAFALTILFRRPVPSVDEFLNPVSIRISYEIDQGGEDFWVSGADGRVKIGERVEVGGSYVRDNNPQDKSELGSVNLAVRLADRTFLISEWARSSSRSIGRGDAERVELIREGDRLAGRVYAVKTDETFDNPSAGVAPGRLEVGGILTYKLTARTLFRLEGLRSEDRITHGRRTGLLVNVEHSFLKYLRLEVGMRYAKETAEPSQLGSFGATPFEYTTVRLKLGMQVPWVPRLGVFGEYEQAVDGTDRKVFAVGGEYQLSTLGRVYARHEFITSLSGAFGLNESQQQNATLVGIDTQYMKDGSVFSEYRIRNALAGRDAEAAIGLRNAWTLAHGVRVHTSIERIQDLDESGSEYSTTTTAATAALEYTANPLWKGTARIEFRTAPTNDSLLHTLGIAYRLSRAVTFLGRYVVDFVNYTNSPGDRLFSRLQTGFAYREPERNVWDILAKYELKYERDRSDLIQTERTVNIVSAHLHYQPVRTLNLNGRYAGKLVSDRSYGIQTSSNAHLIAARAVWDITGRWDAGLIGSILFSDFFRSAQYGLGGEIGYMVSKNLWASAGYNMFGFSDKDLSGEDYLEPGFYLRMRYKFDEDLIAMIGRPVGLIPAEDTAAQKRVE